MELVPRIKQAVQAVLDQRYQYRTDINEMLVNETKPEFSGDYTVVLFSISKTLKTNPVILGKELGTALLDANLAQEKEASEKLAAAAKRVTHQSSAA